LPAIIDRRHKRNRECVSCHNPHDPRHLLYSPRKRLKRP
jgi:predicted CXXCH cytochrome family protein